MCMCMYVRTRTLRVGEYGIEFGECFKTSYLGVPLFSPISVFLNERERDNTAGSVGAGAWGVLSQMTAGSVGIGGIF